MGLGKIKFRAPRPAASGMSKNKLTVVPNNMARPKASGGKPTTLKKIDQASVHPFHAPPVMIRAGNKPGSTKKRGASRTLAN